MNLVSDNQLINYLVRMVIPIRREFGRSLDVQQFLHDFAYAREVLEEALRSQDPRLKEYARYVEGLLHGSRQQAGNPPATTPGPTAPTAPIAAQSQAVPATPGPAPVGGPAGTPAASATEAELRARVLKKYTGGLR